MVNDNAETITAEPLRGSPAGDLAAMQELITKEVSAASEKSISEQMSILAGAIGLDQAQLDL